MMVFYSTAFLHIIMKGKPLQPRFCKYLFKIFEKGKPLQPQRRETPSTPIL